MTSREANTDIVLAARDLGRTFQSGDRSVVALEGATLEVRRGEFVAIQGASGSGKTTLLNLLGGLDRPTAGDIDFGGESLGALSQKRLAALRADRIGFVFQDFCLVSGLTAMDNVRLPMVLSGSRSSGGARARDLLDAVGLSSRGTHFPRELSRGEMQRVAIARALAADPDLLLVDEPTANLDRESSDVVRALLRDCSKEHGKAVLLATHDADLASDADRTVTLRYGRLA